MKTTKKPPVEVKCLAVETDRAKSLGGLRVLVVEDVGMVAMALKSLLEELGCVVIATAARLAEAEDICRRERLDGVLLDLNLHGQYAYPVVDILRERDIPFIIMSGYDAGQLRADLADAPQMQKPFERQSLERLVVTVLCAGESRDRATRHSRGAHSGATDAERASHRTRGEIEGAVCRGMCQFEQEYIGRGPSDVHAHLIGDLLVVRLQGVLTAAEQRMVETRSVGQGRDLLKQVRTLLIETAQKQISSMIQVITGAKVVSMHHDISSVTGEEVVVFSLSQAPPYRVRDADDS
ncbi:MAG: DUF2294 family protein [Phycisphaerales bacterium]|nr:DUF2294 family protein [Phycisphaerales bacterium]